MSSTEEVVIADDFMLLQFDNTEKDFLFYEKEMKLGVIQFHFVLKGEAVFLFNNGGYSLGLKEERSLVLYNPQKELPVNLKISPNSWVLSILISIKKFHSLFSAEAEFIGFLNESAKDKKYYGEENISLSMAIVLNSIFNCNINPSIKNLYYKGKIYELLSLYFNKNDNADSEHCPFLINEDNVLKIRKAKDIIISRMMEPPSLQELADAVNLNIKKLKLGFKQIYGDSVFSFLFEYKMEYARKLLEKGNYNVTEVGMKIGYSSSSHFISAFKKKFGITPKKYIMSINSSIS